MMVVKPQAFNAAAECCLWPRKNGRIPVGFQGRTVLSLYRRVVQRLGGAGISVPGVVPKTALSRDRTAWSSTWSVSLPRIQPISPEVRSNMSPGGEIFVSSHPIFEQLRLRSGSDSREEGQRRNRWRRK